MIYVVTRVNLESGRNAYLRQNPGSRFHWFGPVIDGSLIFDSWEEAMEKIMELTLQGANTASWKIEEHK